MLAVLAVPALWLMWNVARSRQPMAAMYGLLLYSTFLGVLARLPGGLTIPIVLAGTIVGWELLSNGWPRTRHAEPLDVLIVALAAWVFLVWGFRVGVTGVFAGESAREPLVLAIVVLASKLRPQFSVEGLHFLLKPLVAGGVVVALACTAQIVMADPTLFGLLEVNRQDMLSLVGRALGLQGNPNSAAFYLLLGYCAALSLARSPGADARDRGTWFACAGLIVLGILFTQSRSAFLAASVVGAFQAAVMLRMGRWTPVLVLCAAGFVVFVFPEVILAVGENLLSDRVLAATGREEQWAKVLQVITDNPLFGSTTLSHGTKINYHSDLLQLAGYFGLPAAILFALTLLRLLRFSWALSLNPRTGLGWAMLLMVIAEMVHGMFHVLMLSGIAFWMFIGLCVHNPELRRMARR